MLLIIEVHHSIAFSQNRPRIEASIHFPILSLFSITPLYKNARNFFIIHPIKLN